jgi:hypothetical protein
MTWCLEAASSRWFSLVSGGRGQLLLEGGSFCS